MSNYGDRAICKNCGVPIIFTNNEEGRWYWKHTEQRFAEYGTPGVSCQLVAEPS